MISRSFIQTNQAISRLVEAGILKQVTVGRGNRAFEAPDIIAAFTDLERQCCQCGKQMCASQSSTSRAASLPFCGSPVLVSHRRTRPKSFLAPAYGANVPLLG